MIERTREVDTEKQRQKYAKRKFDIDVVVVIIVIVIVAYICAKHVYNPLFFAFCTHLPRHGSSSPLVYFITRSHCCCSVLNQVKETNNNKQQQYNFKKRKHEHSEEEKTKRSKEQHFLWSEGKCQSYTKMLMVFFLILFVCFSRAPIIVYIGSTQYTVIVGYYDDFLRIAPMYVVIRYAFFL